MTRFIGVAPRLPVADLNRTAGFYRDVLGFIVVSLWPDGSPSFAILARDEVHLQFYVANTAEPAEPVGHATIWIDVTDALAIHGALERRVAVEWGPEVYWYGRGSSQSAILTGTSSCCPSGRMTRRPSRGLMPRFRTFTPTVRTL